MFSPTPPQSAPDSWYCGVELDAANKCLFSVGLGPVTILGAGIQITQSALMEPTGEN